MLFSFFYNDTATTVIYTLSLHDALPIYFRWTALTWNSSAIGERLRTSVYSEPWRFREERRLDRKSTRLNSSHTVISYAVFCLKKKILGPLRPSRPAANATVKPARPRRRK